MAKKVATYADLEALPDHLIGELIDGELVVSPRPRPRHSHTATQIVGDLLEPFQRGVGGPGGWWILLEPEIRFTDHVVVPDLAGWRRDLVPALPDVVLLDFVPQWVCEVLSPATALVDRTKKVPLYARHGVDHIWIVDPLLRTLEVYERQGDRAFLAAAHSLDAHVRAAPFDAVEIDLSRWWMPLAGGAVEPAIDWHRPPL